MLNNAEALPSTTATPQTETHSNVLFGRMASLLLEAALFGALRYASAAEFFIPVAV